MSHVTPVHYHRRRLPLQACCKLKTHGGILKLPRQRRSFDFPQKAAGEPLAMRCLAEPNTLLTFTDDGAHHARPPPATIPSRRASWDLDIVR